MKATDLDERFDAAEDISTEIDWARVKRQNLEVQRVNVDFPAWMVVAVDETASTLGVTRQSLIKMWLADRLERRATNGG